MKIVLDDKIPYIRETIGRMGVEARYLRGADITPKDVYDADALIVRTRTRCDERLLRGSRVRFVGTATIGYDHLDTAYLDRTGIRWVNCPGCNAASVRQYMHSMLLLLKRDFGIRFEQTTLGVVGCGHVGSLVAALGRELGLRVIVCDPFINDPSFVTMRHIEREADIITFHVPLTHTAPYPTFHLADEAFFTRLSRRPFIVNTSRGDVVDNAALLQALNAGRIRQAVIDTWEGEPHINLDLLEKAYIGTPHIAGYSADGKVNADNMVLAALCDFFGLPNPGLIAPPPLPADFSYTGDPLQLYNPLTDSLHLKSHPETFEQLRGDYPLRRESYSPILSA